MVFNCQQHSSTKLTLLALAGAELQVTWEFTDREPRKKIKVGINLSHRQIHPKSEKMCRASVVLAHSLAWLGPRVGTLLKIELVQMDPLVQAV